MRLDPGRQVEFGIEELVRDRRDVEPSLDHALELQGPGPDPLLAQPHHQRAPELAVAHDQLAVQDLAAGSREVDLRDVLGRLHGLAHASEVQIPQARGVVLDPHLIRGLPTGHVDPGDPALESGRLPQAVPVVVPGQRVVHGRDVAGGEHVGDVGAHMVVDRDPTIGLDPGVLQELDVAPDADGHANQLARDLLAAVLQAHTPDPAIGSSQDLGDLLVQPKVHTGLAAP